ncbi:MAG: VCBS repeat-containing protein [Desulfuromonadales bacterium]
MRTVLLAVIITLVSAITTFAATPAFTLNQTLSDEAQRTTLAFSALAMVTGNLGAQSFFPPGKVADYTGFQYLRDNDPDSMGHNTSFLTRVAENVIYILNDSQFARLTDLAVSQMSQIDSYGYKRFPLMKAFRRLLDGDIPSGSTGLNLTAVKKASRELYLIDGQISYDRAVLYAAILNSLDSTQKASLAAMKGKGWSSWPDTSVDPIKSAVAAKMKSLPQGSSVAVMTYASDLFSWYAGSVDADVYFCPERQGTYFGSFFIKDAPAIGHEGYSINEQLTATAGRALSDSAAGYVTQSQADLMSSLVETQRNNLYAGSTTIVSVRTQIATLLRTLLTTPDTSGSVKTRVLALSGTYGDLDGENNYNYARVMAQVYANLTTDQKTRLFALRKSIMSGTYADGTPFDFSTVSNSYLYSSVISDLTLLIPYTSYTDYLFFESVSSTTLTVSKSGTGSGSVTSSPSGIACGSTCSGSFTTGTSIILTATADSGSTFAGWSGACSGTGTCTVTMDSVKSAGAIFTLSNTPQPPPAPPSITWQHQGSGKVYGMITNKEGVSGGAQFHQETDSAWSIVGQGDFDANGIRDLVWWNSATGQVYMMLMTSATAVKGGGLIYTEADTRWRIAATGDINGDGKTDLIWWNKSTGQVYAMLINGTTITGGSIIYTEPDTNWKIVAAADFNGNSKAELLWWNSATGRVAIGQTDGTNASTAKVIYTESNTDWRIAGAGDLDGDGKADIIWHNKTTGQVYGMQTNGSSVTNGALMYSEPNTNWEIVSVGNYNADNNADLLWWNQQTGQVYLMLMNGLTAAPGGALIYTEADTTWKIQGETEWRDNMYGRGVTTTTK